MHDGIADGETPQARLLWLLGCVRALADQQHASGVRWMPASQAGEGVARCQDPLSATVANSRPRSVPRIEVPTPEPPRTPPPVTQVRKVSPSTADLFADPGVRAAGSLEALRAHIGDCTRCKLCSGRTNLVFGVGNQQAELMFIGEGPGYDEDMQGEPFVGRAGQLLTEIITKGMKLRRADVYIANIVKCRPPNNRTPEPDEIARCLPFLARQVELVRPRVIVALGTVAVQALLGTRMPIGRLRGAWQDYRGTKVMPTFHPAYLLRNPGEKKAVWADIKQVMKELGLPI